MMILSVIPTMYLSLLTVSLLLVCVDQVLALECAKIDACSCKTANGIIDLHPIGSKDALHPSFPDVPDLNHPGSLFYWNPCYPFDGSFGTKCNGAAVCYKQTSEQIMCGKQTSATFVTDQSKLALRYGFKRSGISGHTYVYLTCNKETPEPGKVTAKQMSEHRMELYYEGRNACDDLPVPSSSSMSAGSIMLIIFFAAVLVYFGAGIAFQIFARKAVGKERVPHLVFWTALPGLIKSGFLFTISCGKRAIGRKTYNNL